MDGSCLLAVQGGAVMPEADRLRDQVQHWQSIYTQALERSAPEEDLIMVGGNLAAASLIGAYRAGLFPMGTGEGGGPPLGWWSPDPRGILPLDGLRITRSLRKSLRRFRLTHDTAFAQVMAGCADPSRTGAWITAEIIESYTWLHQLGLAHSIECWQDDVLVGGLYGVSIGGLFAGESMFHQARDASKAALVGLVAFLNQASVEQPGPRLIDVQWWTEHLASLGVIEIRREEYLDRLAAALDTPTPRWKGAVER